MSKQEDSFEFDDCHQQKDIKSLTYRESEKISVQNIIRNKKELILLDNKKRKRTQTQQEELDELENEESFCFCFKRKRKLEQGIPEEEKSIKNLESHSSFHTEISSKTGTVQKKQKLVQQLPEIDSKEWLKYTLKQLANLDGLEWADRLLLYLKRASAMFQVTRFRGQIYHMNYTKQQLIKIPYRDRLLSNQREMIRKQSTDSANRGLQALQQSKITADTPINRFKKVSELYNDTQTIDQDKLTNIYSIREQRYDDNQINLQLFLYGLPNPKNSNDQTLEPMPDETKQLFKIIKGQLQNIEHPINEIIQYFSIYYRDHYINQILQDKSKKDFYLVNNEKNEEFQIQILDQQQKRLLEKNNNSINLFRASADIKKATFSRYSCNEKQKNNSNRYKQAEEAINEVKQFLCILYGTTVRFYNTIIKYELIEMMKEDLIETLTSILFKHNMNKLVMAFCRVATKDQEMEYRDKIKFLEEIKPKQLGISQYFTLDKHSKIEDFFINHQVQTKGGDVGGSDMIDKDNNDDEILVEKSNRTSINPSVLEEVKEGTIGRSQSLVHKEQSQEFENQLVHTRSYINLKRDSLIDDAKMSIDKDIDNCIFLMSDFSSEESYKEQELNMRLIKQRLRKQPYHKCVQEIQKLKDLETPMERLQCIQQVSKKIVKSVNRFWKGLKVKRDKLTIDGDTHLQIYIYISVKAKVLDCFAHLKFMNEFSTSQVKNSKLGYCMSSLEVALNHIILLQQEDLFDDSLSDKQRSRTKSIKNEIYSSQRNQSLNVVEDPFEEFFKFGIKDQ